MGSRSSAGAVARELLTPETAGPFGHAVFFALAWLSRTPKSLQDHHGPANIVANRFGTRLVSCQGHECVSQNLERECKTSLGRQVELNSP